MMSTVWLRGLARHAPRLWQQQLRMLSTSVEAEHIQRALTEALEGYSYVEQSADQAYLEAEPASRGMKDEYRLRYQKFARSDLNNALDLYDRFCDTKGEEGVGHLKQDNGFMLTVADSLLARDKLDEAVRRGEVKLRNKETLGLDADDLSFCTMKQTFKPAI